MFPEFDPTVLSVAGIPLLLVITGLVQLIKESFPIFFTATPRVRLLALAVSLLVGTTYAVVQVAPAQYASVVQWVFYVIGFGVATSGNVALAFQITKKSPNPLDEQVG